MAEARDRKFIEEGETRAVGETAGFLVADVFGGDWSARSSVRCSGEHRASLMPSPFALGFSAGGTSSFRPMRSSRSTIAAKWSACGSQAMTYSGSLSAPERLSRVRRILVGYDGLDGGRRALERAIAEAHEPHGRITVLSVAKIPLDLDVPRNFGTLDDLSANERQPLAAPPEVVAQLRDASERLATAGLEPELIWTAGDPGRAIVETAKEIRAQVIVLGEHHHGLLGNLFGADVDAEVQREAGCDVILA